MTTTDSKACCTLCPGFCPLGLAWSGPDSPRVEYASAAGGGLCPRGSALGELLASRIRLRRPWRAQGRPRAELKMSEAVSAAAERISSGATVLLDGNIPLEDIAAAAEVASAWPAVRLCLFVAPDDEQVLLGVEASGAPYLADEELAGCDGFVIVGDAFAANPRCARYVLDGIKSHPRSPLVVIDSGGGVTAAFATHRPLCRAGGELEALAGPLASSAVGACRKLGVVLATDAGRGGEWAGIGYQAGKLAAAHAGGVAVQTTGANALAAVRAAKALRLLSPAEAMKRSDGAVLVALGVDVLGLLGWSGPALAVAAAAVPNRTTASAELVLPLALPCEQGGTFLRAGTKTFRTEPLLPPPAGVPTAVQLLRVLAAAAGVKVSANPARVPALERLSPGAPPEAVASASGNIPAGAFGRLVAASQASHDAAGSLAGQASWQGQVLSLPELRVAPADAERLGLADLQETTVRADSQAVSARVRIVGHLAAGTLALSAGSAAARRLVPYAVDAEHDRLVSLPAPVRVGP